MRNNVKTSRSEYCSSFCLLLLHISCFLLVVFYVNMFQFWAWISKQLGPGTLTRLLPILATVAVLLVISAIFVRRVNRGHSINMVFLGLGLVGAFFALAIPDPHVPIKRIHVAEYILLAFLVRFTLSQRLTGLTLTLFTALVTILLGVHDEMLQGFHSLRYYGWRDIIVNGVAGISGTFLGHALFSFDQAGRVKAMDSLGKFQAFRLACILFLLYGAVTLLVVSLYQQRGEPVSLYPTLPLGVICLLMLFVYRGKIFDSQKHHGVQAVFWLAALLLVYPVLIRFSSLEFI